MAEEEKENEAAEEASQEAKAGFFARNKLLIIIGGVLFLLLAIGAPVAYFMMSGPDEKDVELERVAEEIALEAEKLTIEGFEEEEEWLDDEERLGAIYPFKTFIVNLDEGGYLRAQVQLEFTQQSIPRKFHTKLVPIEDSLIELLSSRSRQNLESNSDRLQLRISIREKVNELLRKPMVKRVYFTQFVVQ